MLIKLSVEESTTSSTPLFSSKKGQFCWRGEISDLYLELRAPRPPQYVTRPLNDLSVASLRLSTSTRRLSPRRLLQYLTFPLCCFGRREKTAPRVLVEFLPSSYVRHTHTMAAAVFHSVGLNCREEYLSIKHCLTCGRSVPSKHIAQTSMRRQEGKA